MMIEEPSSLVTNNNDVLGQLSSSCWNWAVVTVIAMPFVGYGLVTTLRNKDNASFHEGQKSKNHQHSHYTIEQEFLKHGPRRTLYATSHIELPLTRSSSSSPDEQNSNSNDNGNEFRQQMLASLSDIDKTLGETGMDHSNITRIHFYTTDVDTFLDNFHLYSEWIGDADRDNKKRRSQTLPRDLTGINRFETPNLLVMVEIEAQDCHVQLNVDNFTKA